MNWTAIKAAERLGEKKVEELAIRALPVDPIKIARDHDIEVMKQPLTGCAGCLVRKGEAFWIICSSELNNEGFENFTVSHELGHYFLPGHPQIVLPNGDGMHKSQGGFVSKLQHEREADQFAVGLLLPSVLFKPATRQAGAGFPAIKTLAAKCKTSLTATAIRYAAFAEDPVAVILSDGPRVCFCAVSEAVESIRGLQRLRNGDPVPSATLTARFNRAVGRVDARDQDEGWTDLSQWFDDAPDFEMKEDVVGLGGYGRTLTVLFSEEELDDEDDELNEDDD